MDPLDTFTIIITAILAGTAVPVGLALALAYGIKELTDDALWEDESEARPSGEITHLKWGDIEYGPVKAAVNFEGHSADEVLPHGDRASPWLPPEPLRNFPCVVQPLKKKEKGGEER